MISYIGGKGRIGKWIEPHIPKDIETYVEPFGGMFWVFFKLDLSKYPKLKTVVYNDYNGLNANLFECSKQYDKLLDEMSKYECQQLKVVDTDPKFRETFVACQKEVFNPEYEIGDEPNFDAAVKYLYVLTHVFSGSKPETATFTDYKGKYRSKFLIFMDKLNHPAYREHFDKITFVENLDFADVMLKYDSPTTYFYLDPPYWKTENYYSNHDFDVDDHRRLADIIKTLFGRFSLSYYEFPQLLGWFPKNDYFWRTKQFKKAASAKKDGTQNMGTELLIMNYNPPIPPEVAPEEEPAHKLLITDNEGNVYQLKQEEIDWLNEGSIVGDLTLDSHEISTPLIDPPPIIDLNGTEITPNEDALERLENIDVNEELREQLREDSIPPPPIIRFPGLYMKENSTPEELKKLIKDKDKEYTIKTLTEELYNILCGHSILFRTEEEKKELLIRGLESMFNLGVNFEKDDN